MNKMNKGLINRLTDQEIRSLIINQFSKKDIEKTISNNALIDYSFRNSNLLNPKIKEKFDVLSPKELNSQLEEAKKESVLELALNITPSCNAACGICYTSSKSIRLKKQQTINIEQSKEIINQAVDLGAKSLFISGTGEPTLDPRIFDILHHAKNKGMDSYVFVNGITLSNDNEAEKYWGVSAIELVARFKETETYIAPKLWSLKPTKFEQMTGTLGKYKFVNMNGLIVPRIFENFEKLSYPKEKIIVNMAVTTQNFDEVDDIVNFCLDKGYKIFIEEFVQTGRGKNKSHLSLSSKQKEYLSRLAPEDCIKPKLQVVISYDGYLMECKAINTEKMEENSLISPNGEEKNIFQMRHSINSLVKVKYDCSGRCYCESRQY
jgi:MoaA/NifB/PqqE/SkfB family radical SAM enzyme